MHRLSSSIMMPGDGEGTKTRYAKKAKRNFPMGVAGF
jgi:hypothetical protein